jgi:MraZ protein
MFAGKYNNAIDVKGRCIVPAKFRNELGSSCYLVKGFDNDLYLYPCAYWDKYTDEHFENRPDEDGDAMDIKLMFYANTLPCEIDKQGRINIPQDFLDYAGVTRDMVNIGFKNRIQIWAKERFDEKMADIAPRGRELFSSMNKYVSKP